MKEYDGPFNFNFVGSDAYEIYRIEKGIPDSPNELSATYNPHELDLLNMVDFKKGCYIGQEVIARLDTYDKVQKKLKGLSFGEKLRPGEKYTLFDSEGKEAGVVTSTTFSKKLDRAIGLGFVRRFYLEPGTKLSARSENSNPVQATVENLPFVR